jgi:hypothetical protein
VVSIYHKPTPGAVRFAANHILSPAAMVDSGAAIPVGEQDANVTTLRRTCRLSTIPSASSSSRERFWSSPAATSPTPRRCCTPSRPGSPPAHWGRRDDGDLFAKTRYIDWAVRRACWAPDARVPGADARLDGQVAHGLPPQSEYGGRTRADQRFLSIFIAVPDAARVAAATTRIVSVRFSTVGNGNGKGGDAVCLDGLGRSPDEGLTPVLSLSSR